MTWPLPLRVAATRPVRGRKIRLMGVAGSVAGPTAASSPPVGSQGRPRKRATKARRRVRRPNARVEEMR